MGANGREGDCLLYCSLRPVHLQCWERCTLLQKCSIPVPFSSVTSVSHVTINPFSLIRSTSGSDAVLVDSLRKLGQGSFLGGYHWSSVFSATSQCSLSSVFLDWPSLLSATSRLFIGPVPLTLGLDAGQIDWKNARCLVPDTSLSITLAPRREEKFPLTRLPCSLAPIFRVPQPPLTRDGSVTKLSVILMCISVVLSLPLTLPVDWNCCHSKSIRNGS